MIRERSEGEAVVLCRDMASGLGGGVRVIFLQGCGSRPNEEKHILVRRCCCHQHFSKELLEISDIAKQFNGSSGFKVAHLLRHQGRIKEDRSPPLRSY